MDENTRRSTSFTRQHCKILQILENKVLRIITGHGYDTPVSQLLQESGQLSVHQQIAYHTLLTLFKVVKTGQPGYLAARLGVAHDTQQERVGARRRQHDIRLEYTKSISREGTLYRGKILWNSLPVNLRTIGSIASFKRRVKVWIKENISIIPE